MELADDFALAPVPTLGRPGYRLQVLLDRRDVSLGLCHMVDKHVDFVLDPDEALSGFAVLLNEEVQHLPRVYDSAFAGRGGHPVASRLGVKRSLA